MNHEKNEPYIAQCPKELIKDGLSLKFDYKINTKFNFVFFETLCQLAARELLVPLTQII